MYTNKSNRQWLFVKRPKVAVDESCFEKVEREIPEISEGQVLLRNVYFSFDASMRTWMNDGPNYLDPLKLGEPMRCVTLAEVIQSKNVDFAVGAKVMGMHAWEDYSVSDGAGFSQLLPDLDGVPSSWFLGALGPTGYTAYFGIMDIGQPKLGDSVLISGAAGAVGSVAGQIAKLCGARVVGLAGSDEKCRWIEQECGFDEAINYKKCQDLVGTLKKVFPKGIDVYFDNVGGSILDAALLNIADKARVVSCGILSGYDKGANPSVPVKNIWMLLIREARMQGFLVSSFLHRAEEAAVYLGSKIKSGDIVFREHIEEGFDNAPKVLMMLYAGQNNGKLLLKL